VPVDNINSLKVFVYGFRDDISGGKLSLLDLAGNAIGGRSGDISASGAFMVLHAVNVPDRFQVRVTGLRTAAGLEPLPDPLQTVVEHPGGDLVINVTPLSALVARYAIRKGQSLDQAKAAIAQYLQFPTFVDPCDRIPDDITPEANTPFSFPAFREAWIASGRTFIDFLDVHVDLAGEGRTTNAFLGEPGEEKSWGYWFKKGITKGATAGVVREGLGWLFRVIIDAPTMKDIKSQLDDMSKKLDHLSQQLADFEAKFTSLLLEMKMDLRYQNMIRSIAVIESRYNRMMYVPKYEDKASAQVEIDSIDADFSLVHQELLALDMYLRPQVGSTFYQVLMDYLVDQARQGKDVSALMEQYMNVFNSLSGVQAKGLLLVVEHYQKVLAKVDVQAKVESELAVHMVRMYGQSSSFLDNAERMVAEFKSGGSTLDYRVGGIFPNDGDSPLYAKTDAIVGDVMGADSQLVSRLTWDDTVTDFYPGADRDPADTTPNSYETIFAFMRDRMNRLAAVDDKGKGAALAINLVSQTGSRVKAMDEKGTVNIINIERRKDGRTLPPARVKVLRHVFRDFPFSESGIRYAVTPDAAQAATFEVTAPTVRGTVGPRVYGPPPVNGTTHDVSVDVAVDRSYLTVPLFAWVPPYLLARIDRPADAGRFLYSDTDASKAGYFIKSEGYYYLGSDDRPGLVYCDTPSQQFRHSLWREAVPDGQIVRFGEEFKLCITNGPFCILFDGPTTRSAYGKYKYKGYATTFKILPVPDFVRRFIADPAAVTAPQLGVATYLKVGPGYGYINEYMREMDYCGAIQPDGTAKDMTQRWTFEKW
jgi:hypothetical protein